MRLAKPCLMLLTAAFLIPSAPVQSLANTAPGEAGKAASPGTGAEPAKAPTSPTASGEAAPAATSTPAPAAASASASSGAASRAEVEELRMEVAELKAAIRKLMEAKGLAPERAKPDAAMPEPLSSPPPSGSPTVLAAEPTPDPDSGDGFWQGDKQNTSAPPAVAGWNGEHFFIKSADGQFQLQPYGYVQTDYRAFDGDGAPPNTFLVRRGRFGFQGNYGSHFSFGLLVDGAATSGAEIRDIFLNVKFKPEFQFQGGQFKVFFGQELATGATNLDFVERGLQSLLYPDAASAYRSLGAGVFGDVKGGIFQYWLGAFNGKGFNISNTSSVPEVDTRVRFYPWRKHTDSFFQGFSFGGAMSFSRTVGLSNESTPSMTNPDNAFTYLPSFRTNGDVWRYNGEFALLRNQWGIRGEYVQAYFDRRGVGTLQFGGLGFSDLPVVRFKAWNVSTTYLLTGEKRPENGIPRVKHPLFGPVSPGESGGHGWGAFELAFRFSGIQGNEPSIFFNNVFGPQLVPGYSQHTQNYTVGLNWYLNYWIEYKVNFSIDKLLQPSTIGATPQTYFVALQRLQFRF